MNVDTQNRSTSPTGIAGANQNKNTYTGPEIKETRRYLFTGTDTQGSRTSESASGRKIAAEELGNRGIFSANTFSPEFARAYKKLQTAIHSTENRYYENEFGWLSPSAEEALRELSVIVDTKSNQKQASAAARTAFDITPLNPDEEAAWNGLLHQLPPVYNAYLPICSPWREVSHAEVHAALSKDSAMAAVLAKPEGQLFVDGLVKSMNEKSKSMSPSDNGMAITLRFPECYGTTGHIALAGVWFDENKQLKISFCHQESLIFPQPDKPVLGVVYDKFDTSADYPGHYAPAVECMKLAGPPAANVFPCPHPEAIVSATKDNSGLHNRRLYAPTYTWNEKQLTERLKKAGKTPEEISAELSKQKAEFGDRRPETCFNVTHKVLAAMYYAEPKEDGTMPTIIRKTTGFASNRPGEFDMVKDKSGKPLSLDQVPSLSFAEQAKTFLDIGKAWGRSLPWDVPLQTKTVVVTPIKRQGPLAWNLPPGARGVKFIASTAGLKLNGKPVKPSITYSVEEAQQMVYEGKVDPAKQETFQALSSASIQATSTSTAKL